VSIHYPCSLFVHQDKLKGKKPKLSPSQRKHLLTLHAAGEHTQAELAELFNVSRTTIYRELRRTTADT
jgi:IS30 family transposase